MAPQQEPREDGREPPPLRAAQYVRMSTDHQQYSTENQAEKIREYAERHGLRDRSQLCRRGQERAAAGGPRPAAAADRRRRERRRRLPGGAGLRRQPLGPLPGRRRERLLRVRLQARRHRRALLRRAVRQRRLAGLDHRQGGQAGDGRRVLARAVGQGVRRPVPADRARLPAGRHRRLRAQADARRPARADAGPAPPRRAEEPADRPGDPGAGAGGRDRHGRPHLPPVRRGRQDGNADRRDPQRRRDRHRPAAGRGPAAACIRCSPTRSTSATTSTTGSRSS